MRVVVLYTSGHLGSAAILSEMARWPEIQIVGLVRAEALSLGEAGAVAKARRHLGKLGTRFSWLLCWQRLVQMVGFGIGRLMPWRRRVRSGQEIASELAVPTLTTHDINGAAARAWIAARSPDLLVSACFAQILRAPAIALPRIGVLNVHPGWLPSQRGAMAYFWPLRNGESHSGATVHWIDEGIDTGALLARRRLRLGRRSTQQRVLVRSCIVGARLCRRVVRQLVRGRQPTPILIDNESSAYFPMPGRADFEDYFARRRFFRIRDVLGVLVRPA